MIARAFPYDRPCRFQKFEATETILATGTTIWKPGLSYQVTFLKIENKLSQFNTIHIEIQRREKVAVRSSIFSYKSIWGSCEFSNVASSFFGIQSAEPQKLIAVLPGYSHIYFA